MITEYFVCYASSPEGLRDEVNKAIGNGWQPLGGVSAVLVDDCVDFDSCTYEQERFFCQAVVK